MQVRQEEVLCTVITIQQYSHFSDDEIVIYITYAVGYILQRAVFRLKHDRAAGVF
jgi:hypothetical protein